MPFFAAGTLQDLIDRRGTEDSSALRYFQKSLSEDDPSTPDVDEGNSTGAPGPINVPGDIDIDPDGIGPLPAVNFALPAVDDGAGEMALVHYIDCNGAAATDAFEPDPGPEIDVDLSTITCDDATASPPGDTTVVVYFVTVQ